MSPVRHHSANYTFISSAIIQPIIVTLKIDAEGCGEGEGGGVEAVRL